MPNTASEGVCVVAVAILDDQGGIWSLPAPRRHAHVLSHAREYGVQLPSLEDSQGFLLSNGKFARRMPSLAIATRMGQLKDGGPTAPHVGLFSEDVW